MVNLLRLVKNYEDFRREPIEREGSGPTVEAPDETSGTPETTTEARVNAAGAGDRRTQETSVPGPAPVPPERPAHDTTDGAATESSPPPVSPAKRTAPTPPVESPASTMSAQDLYERALVVVARMFEAAAMGDVTTGRLGAALEELERLCPEIVHSIAAGRGLLRKAMGTYAEGEGFVLPHSVNVAVLAVELGLEMGVNGRDLPELCLAGLVHDLGSVRLPMGLLTKSESLTPTEWEQMRARPVYTYETLLELGQDYGQVAEIAHQVYERLDGSGYPRGLQGDEILPQARILGTVDFFESFAHPRPYKATLPGTANHGIQMLMQMADKFGSSTLKALVGSIGLFPIGSYVRLSSGEIGRVVDVKKQNPMRPQVEVLLDSQRRPAKVPRVLDLLSIPHVHVSRALTASDLRQLGMLPSPSEMPPFASPGNDRA